MAREIHLDGAEVSILKSLGVGSGDMEGTVLLERCAGMDLSELIDVIKGLMSIGYVDADSESFHSLATFGKVHFRVNPGYAKDLYEALDPTPEARKSKRVRRE